MNCPHLETRVELMPPGHIHYGKIICVACGAFRGWAKHPRTIERDARTAAELVRLRSDERLSAQERAFITKLDGTGPKMSPRQRDWFDSIAAKYV